MTRPLVFGFDRVCPTCKGKGTILDGRLRCGVCGGDGIAHERPSKRGVDSPQDQPEQRTDK